MPRNFDDWLDGYMQYTEDTEPAKLYRKWVGISTIASALQRKVWLPVGKVGTWFPNFFIILVGPSGKARKGTAMGPGKKLIKEIEGIKIAAQSVTKEALVRNMAEANQTSFAEDDESKPILHSSLTIFSEELTVFLGYSNRELMAYLTDWYDCEHPWVNETKTQGVDVIQGTWLNLLGATTPKLIRTTLPEDAVGGGFTSRVIFVFEEDKEKAITPWAIKRDEETFELLLEDLREIHQCAGQVSITPAFSDYFTDAYYRLEEKPAVDHPRFGGYNNRRAGHMVKLAMVLSASESNSLVLEKRHIKRADKILSNTEVKMPRTFHGTGTSDKSEVTSNIMTYIAHRGKTTEQEIFQRFYQDLDGLDDLRDILQALKMMQFISTSVNMKSTQVIFNEDSEVAQTFTQTNGRSYG